MSIHVSVSRTVMRIPMRTNEPIAPLLKYLKHLPQENSVACTLTQPYHPTISSDVSVDKLFVKEFICSTFALAHGKYPGS